MKHIDIPAFSNYEKRARRFETAGEASAYARNYMADEAQAEVCKLKFPRLYQEWFGLLFKPTPNATEKTIYQEG